MLTVRSATLPLALALCVAAFGAAGAASGGSRGAAEIRIVAEEAGGVRVFEIENRAGLGGARYWINGTWTGDHRPWHVQFVRPDGAVVPFLNLHGFTPDGDQANWGQGDGALYAGSGDATVQSPDAMALRDPLRIDWSDRLPGTSGRLVVAWAAQAGPTSFVLHLSPGTRVTPVAAGPAETFEMKDFQEGLRAGVAPAALVAVGDALVFEPSGSQLWGYVFHMKSAAAGRGALAVERTGDGWRREMSLDATPGVDRSCVCYDSWGRWVFTSASQLRVELDYAGDGGRTEVYVLVARLPSGTLPDDVWAEFDLTPA